VPCVGCTVTVNDTTRVKARILDGAATSAGNWSAMNTATYVVGPLTSDLRITEIHYNPTFGLNTDFIEIKNIGSGSVNLNWLTFSEGIDFTFPDTTLAAGAYIVVVKDTTAFVAAYGGGPTIAGEYTGILDSAGERIRLADGGGTTILDFNYKDGWYPVTDGGGFSLTTVAIVNAANPDPLSWGDKDTWRPSSPIGGTPGAADTGTVPAPGAIMINEVLAHSPDAAPDWIELHNTTGSPINIGGWFISDSGGNLTKFEVPNGITIPANGYHVFYEDTDFGAPNPGTPFALSENGETVIVTSGSSGAPTSYSQQESFGASDQNRTIGRYEKSGGTFNFVAMVSATPGASNSAPLVGPVVISEIMYNPSSGDQTQEYVELRNTTGSPVSLYDGSLNKGWKFTDGIDFTFPNGTSLLPGARLLVVKDVASFTATYGSPGVQVFGPYAGQLSNGGERLQLGKPGDVDGFGVRQYIRVDRVNYDDVAPWPTTPDGGGTALDRTVDANYGNDVANWTSAAATPGS